MDEENLMIKNPGPVGKVNQNVFNGPDKPRVPKIELPGDVRPPQIENPQTVAGMRLPIQSVKKPYKPRGIGGKLFSMMMLILGLSVGFAVLGNYLPKPQLTKTSSTATPSATL